ncbi:MAG: adenylyl-sulfate kinase [Alphaproteobacteria bacterium]|nr:adenylyl-sulfate kinase [Alphaproteobacteria bacterium]
MTEEKPLLRILSCGSVDDGKSTLIGRMLYDLGVLYEDQLAFLEKERTADGRPDFSGLLDGLLAEREQAITIDVAYRSFRTPARRYIVADAPGHEQYTRNMVTGASKADAALLLIDATRAKDGLLPQTVRHSIVCAMLGVPHIIVAVNKMDLAGYSEDVFKAIEAEYLDRIKNLSFRSVSCIPVSALGGDNICFSSANMPWYQGLAVLDILEALDTAPMPQTAFCMPVQGVSRQGTNRWLMGTVLSGTVRVGDKVCLSPSGRTGTIERLADMSGDLATAQTEQAVNIKLAEDVDVGRGEVLFSPDYPLEEADQIAAKIIWLNDPHLALGRSYFFRLGTAEAWATVTELSYKIDLNTLAETPSKELRPNDVGRIKLSLDRKLPMMPYAKSRDLGGFLLIDRISGSTLGAGMVDYVLHRSHSVFPHAFELSKEAFAAQKSQKPCVVWLTGLSASGKSTVANLTAKLLYAKGFHVYTLDGDNLRSGLNRDLGFTEADRVENIRRASEVAKLMADAGLVVLASFISPYRTDRMAIRERFPPGEFFEIFVDTPLEICESRDSKGLYAKARAGVLPHFTGISAPFEQPENPDLHMDGMRAPELLAQELVEFITKEIQSA